MVEPWDGAELVSAAERDDVMTLGRALRELEAYRQAVAHMMLTVARLTEAHAAALREAEAKARDTALVWAAYIARHACLVPPDGGSPSPEEVAVCDETEKRILACVGHEPSALSARDFEHKATALRAAAAKEGA